jgi:hypothetical protein
MFRVTVILVLGAVALLFSAVSEYWLSWKTSSEPQLISVQDLVDNGPGNNHYVEIANYDFVVVRSL